MELEFCFVYLKFVTEIKLCTNWCQTPVSNYYIVRAYLRVLEDAKPGILHRKAVKALFKDWRIKLCSFILHSTSVFPVYVTDKNTDIWNSFKHFDSKLRVLLIISLAVMFKFYLLMLLKISKQMCMSFPYLALAFLLPKRRSLLHVRLAFFIYTQRVDSLNLLTLLFVCDIQFNKFNKPGEILSVIE